MVSSTQVMYTRALPSLAPLPIGTPATDQSIIPSYTTYFNDIWHVKPSFTLTYGLGWSLEMPPYELQGKQVELVDSNNQPISRRGLPRPARGGCACRRVVHPRDRLHPDQKRGQRAKVPL